MGEPDLTSEPVSERLPRRAANLATRTVAGETIAVPIRASAADLESIYVFNEVGARIWSLLDGCEDREAIARELAREFEVGEAAAREDVSRFLHELADLGLVEAAEPGP
jgi:hypothetical protein